jgi:hypothetical protein
MREKTQVTNNRNETEDTTVDQSEITIIREYFKPFYIHTFF